MKSIFLLPGRLEASRTSVDITTILGSCVAVALHDPHTHAGALNHYLLPGQKDGADRSLRYGTYSIEQLVLAMERLGCQRRGLLAKVFGGAAVIEDFAFGDTVGALNVECAYAELKRLGIPIIGGDVGGNLARHLVYSTSTFHVAVRYPKGEY